ncbi:MAG: hypothetical protein ACNS63_03065 [Candidatus Nitrospinota bacterium M3_3B_026]
MRHKEDVIRFDVLHGRCAVCGGPIYFSSTIDWEGARVNSLHCWNGHYESIEIDHSGSYPLRELTMEEIERILPFVSIVRMEDKNPG